LLLGFGALVPGSEEKTEEGVANAGRAIDGENMREFGRPAHAFVQALRRLLGIIQVADLRRFNQRQQNALVLLGSELARGRGVHDGG
jgi:hypothetical protein